MFCLRGTFSLFCLTVFVNSNVDAVDLVSIVLPLHSTMCYGMIATVFALLCAKKIKSLKKIHFQKIHMGCFLSYYIFCCPALTTISVNIN